MIVEMKFGYNKNKPKTQSSAYHFFKIIVWDEIIVDILPIMFLRTSFIVTLCKMHLCFINNYYNSHLRMLHRVYLTIVHW